MNRPNEKEYTPFEHGYYGLEGYEKYSLQSNAVDTGYLLWNKTMQAKITNETFNWNGIFEAKPYIQYRKPHNSGYIFPNFDTVTNRDLDLFMNKRHENYTQFLSDFGFYDQKKAEQFSSIHSALSLIHSQLERQVEQLEQIDKILIQALKVFYYECECYIREKMPHENQLQYINELTSDLKHLYQVGIRKVAETDRLLEKWIPKRIGKEFVPDKIGLSLRNAVAHLLPRKEPIIKALIPIFEKCIHLETAKFKLLNDEQLSENSNSIPVSQGAVTQSAIKQAVYNKRNPDEAELFIREYSKLHEKNPKVTNADAINKIVESFAEITVSDRTLNTWIRDYIDALKRLDAVQK